jgi:hypothetical protein
MDSNNTAEMSKIYIPDIPVQIIDEVVEKAKEKPKKKKIMKPVLSQVYLSFSQVLNKLNQYYSFLKMQDL